MKHKTLILLRRLFRILGAVFLIPALPFLMVSKLADMVKKTTEDSYFENGPAS